MTTPTLEQSLYSRIAHERKTRFWSKATALFGACMATIYLTTSDRIKIDDQTNKRIEASGKIEDRGGLSINGIVVPFTAQYNTLTLDDYLSGQTHTYNVQATKSTQHPIDNVLFTFKRGKGTYVQELDFSTAVPLEKKELTFAGTAELQEITITYSDGKKYSVALKGK